MTIHFNKAKHLYQKSEKTIAETDDTLNIVKTMVKELKKSMNIVAINSNNKEKRIKRSKHFSKALVIIYTLQTSLDFEKGGDLATKLFQIYEYCRQQLIADFRNKINTGIHKATKALEEIFSLNENGETGNV